MTFFGLVYTSRVYNNNIVFRSFRVALSRIFSSFTIIITIIANTIINNNIRIGYVVIWIRVICDDIANFVSLVFLFYFISFFDRRRLGVWLKRTTPRSARTTAIIFAITCTMTSQTHNHTI